MHLITYDQMVIELDKLFFSGKINSYEQAEERAETIEGYLEAVGWTWDDIIKRMAEE